MLSRLLGTSSSTNNSLNHKLECFPLRLQGIYLTGFDQKSECYHYFYPSLRTFKKNGVLKFGVLLAARVLLKTLFIVSCSLFYEDSLGKILFNFIIGRSHTSPEWLFSFFTFKISWSLWIMSLVMFPFVLWLLESSDHHLMLWFISNKHVLEKCLLVCGGGACVCMCVLGSLFTPVYFSLHSLYAVLIASIIYFSMLYKFISCSHNCWMQLFGRWSSVR